MFASPFGEGDEKVVNIGRSGRDLPFLADISLFVSDIDG